MKFTRLSRDDFGPLPVPEPLAQSPPEKRSTVRHTRAIARDRSKRPTVAPPDPVIAAHVTAILQPATLSQVAHFQALGCRARILTLPVMVALVVTMVWRQIGAVATLVRMLQTEGFFWNSPVRVSEHALSQRFGSFPAEGFHGVLTAILPAMAERWQGRTHPLSPALAWVRDRYSAVLAVDGSTLDALVRKAGLLREAVVPPLAGRMIAVLDLLSRLPTEVWYEPDAQAHDQRWWAAVRAAIPAGALVVLDLGWTNFAQFLALAKAGVVVVTRAKSNLVAEVERVLQKTATIHDTRVWVGQGADRQLLRCIAVCYRGTWYRYLTSELDPERLPADVVVALYRHRWRIEEAFNTVKRLLGLAYCWVGSQNGVAVQVWATWILYAVLIDLTDAVADRLGEPVGDLSLEMVYRSVYFFATALQRGETTDPVEYFADHADPSGSANGNARPSIQSTPCSS